MALAELVAEEGVVVVLVVVGAAEAEPVLVGVAFRVRLAMRLVGLRSSTVVLPKTLAYPELVPALSLDESAVDVAPTSNPSSMQNPRISVYSFVYQDACSVEVSPVVTMQATHSSKPSRNFLVHIRLEQALMLSSTVVSRSYAAQLFWYSPSVDIDSIQIALHGLSGKFACLRRRAGPVAWGEH